MPCIVAAVTLGGRLYDRLKDGKVGWGMTIEELEKITNVNYDNASFQMRLAMFMTCVKLDEEENV